MCGYGWLVVLGFNATLTAKVISWRSVTHNVFPGFLTPVLTQLSFPKPPTTFLTCFCRGERRKYARKKSRLKRGSNSQPPGHESDTLTTEPPRRAVWLWNRLLLLKHLRRRYRVKESPTTLKGWDDADAIESLRMLFCSRILF